MIGLLLWGYIALLLGLVLVGIALGVITIVLHLVARVTRRL